MIDEARMVTLLKNALKIMTEHGISLDDQDVIAEGMQLHVLYQIERGEGPIVDILNKHQH